MIGMVALKELARDWRLWLGGFVVIVVAAGALSAVLSQFETAVTLPDAQSESLLSMTRGTMLFTMLATVAVTGATTNLAVASGRRGYALLQLAGVLPRQVRLIVLTQLAVLATVASTLGVALGTIVARPLLELASAEASLTGLPVAFGASTVAWTVAAMVAIVMLSGLRAAWRAGSVPPIEALREPEPVRITMGILRWIGVGFSSLMTIILASALFRVSPIATLLGEDPQGSFAVGGIVGLGQLLAIVLTALVASLGPIVYPALLRVWTAAFPSALSTAWFLARRSSRFRVTQSMAAVTPLMVAIALTGSLYTLFLTVSSALGGNGGGNDINHASVFTILGPALLLAAIGAAAVIFMTGRTRARDNALVEVSGGTLTTLSLMAIFEALIYVGTAFIAGAIIFGTVGFLASSALKGVVGVATPVFGVAIALLVAAAGAVLIGVATLIPTLTARRTTVPAALAQS